MNEKKPTSRQRNHGSPQSLFKLIPQDKGTRYSRNFFLVYKGKTFTGSSATKINSKTSESRWTYDVNEPELTAIARAATLDDWGVFQRINLKDRQPWRYFERDLHVSWNDEPIWDDDGNWVGREPTGLLELDLWLEVDPVWNGEFSFLEFCRIANDIAAGISVSVYTGDDDWDSITLKTTLKPTDESLGNMISQAEALLDSVVERALDRIENEDVPPSVSQIFQFPAGLEIPCEQYLQYFSQFLRDQGINAKTRIEDNAGHVLFSVIPADGNEALKRIREALAVYLHLPEADVIFDDGFQSMRLQQQVENLKHSQKMAGRELKLAQQVIESQDHAIGQRDLVIDEKNRTISQQQRIIELMKPSVMMDSAKNKDELEDIYDGIRVGESEFLKKYLGIGLNPVKALSAAGKSILGKDYICPSIIETEDSD